MSVLRSLCAKEPDNPYFGLVSDIVSMLAREFSSNQVNWVQAPV